MGRNVIYIVVPCYNESEGLKQSCEKLEIKMNELIKTKKMISKKSKVMLVNDGSKDDTGKIITEICENNSLFSGLLLSKNVGHQNAILAGMMTSKDYADAVITIDADLQQDINALDNFIEKFQDGNEIVYGIRNDRSTDGVFKKMTATLYYKLLSFLGVDIIPNHADYRLMSKKALEALGEFKEVNLFLRGLIHLIGFQSDTVYFDVKEREFGKSKYTLSKMLTLATDGITSLSIKPIRIIMIIGVVMFLLSIIMIGISIIDWFKGVNVAGYTTSLISIWLVGGITILSLGIIGEYIGRIYMETKHRPRYIIESFIWKDENKR
ncbi:MAG: glycosyltransferase family 2 protein [Anaerorhabdus sp.]|uniref:glycosyltransferase family 2 protein n=1 Tax=Anaerorhabdus sp. TaxID=1872524 RepID=UPI002FC7317A